MPFRRHRGAVLGDDGTSKSASDIHHRASRRDVSERLVVLRDFDNGASIDRHTTMVD